MAKQVAKEKTCKAAPEKKETVKHIAELGKKYPIIGVVNMENLPAANLLKIKKQLKDKVELVMTRKTLMELGLKKLNLENSDELLGKLKGSPALMFTDENPFTLYKIIKKNKTPAPAKPGQEAPYDITLPAGPTPFAPGPVISEFAQLGIPAGVEEGKVAIKEETTVVREGEQISEQLAGMLQRLNIEPMEVGMDLVAVYEKGTIYGRKVLDIDEEQFAADLAGAASAGLNLAVEMGYTTPDTISTLIAKAFSGAKNVGVEANILEPDLVADVLAKAQRIAQGIHQQTQ